MTSAEELVENVLKNYFVVQKTVLKFSGISLHSNESKFYKLYSFLTLLLMVFLYTIIECLELFNHLHEFDVIINILSYNVTHILGM